MHEVFWVSKAGKYSERGNAFRETKADWKHEPKPKQSPEKENACVDQIASTDSSATEDLDSKTSAKPKHAFTYRLSSEKPKQSPEVMYACVDQSASTDSSATKNLDTSNPVSYHDADDGLSDHRPDTS